MILNPFHGTGLFLCPVKWVKDNFNTCQWNNDLCACSITEHAFL